MMPVEVDCINPAQFPEVPMRTRTMAVTVGSGNLERQKDWYFFIARSQATRPLSVLYKNL